MFQMMDILIRQAGWKTINVAPNHVTGKADDIILDVSPDKVCINGIEFSENIIPQPADAVRFLDGLSKQQRKLGKLYTYKVDIIMRLRYYLSLAELQKVSEKLDAFIQEYTMLLGEVNYK